MPLVAQYLLFGVAVVSFLGATFVFLRGSRDKGTIESLEKNSDALNERVVILEAEIERRKSADLIRDAADSAKDDRISALERENEVLRTVDGAADKITALAAALSKHHTQAMTGMDTLHTDLVRLNTLLGGDDEST